MGVEIADIVRRHAGQYFARYGEYSAEKRILSDIEKCRTAALGGHCYRCAGCRHGEIAYNSCRNRHCPKCLGSKTSKWLSARASELLNVNYYHCVFTLPAPLRAVALSNRVLVFDALFKAASETLLEVAANPKHLGARLGFFGILHTWTQTLDFHPHVHFVVPGGGIKNDEWVHIRKRKKFFLPVRVLSTVFRGKFCDLIRKSAAKTDSLPKDMLEAALQSACQSDWVVYIKRPFRTPEIVLKYLSQYTHRVAISNRRILSLNNGFVTFRARKPNGPGTIKLSAVEFLRRFLLHRLPKQYTKIRHFGFLANRHRTQNLKIVQALLPTRNQHSPAKPGLICKACSQSNWLKTDLIPPIVFTFPIKLRAPP